MAPVKLTPDLEKRIASYLGMFRPETYSIECKDDEVKNYCVDQKLIKWVPPIFGSNRQYEITMHGWAWLRDYQHDLDCYAKEKAGKRPY
jgi:hypothetical protein